MIEVAGIPVVVNPMDSSRRKFPDISSRFRFDNRSRSSDIAAIIARGHRHIAHSGARLDERTIITEGWRTGDAGRWSFPYSVMMEPSSSYLPVSNSCAVRDVNTHSLTVFAPTMTGGGAARMPAPGAKNPDDMATPGSTVSDIGQ